MTKKLLHELIEQIKISHKWLIDGAKLRVDQLGNPGNYSAELNHAIEVQKILDTI